MYTIILCFIGLLLPFNAVSKIRFLSCPPGTLQVIHMQVDCLRSGSVCVDHWFCFHMLVIMWHAGESQVFGCVLHPVCARSLQLVPSVEVTCGICGEGQKLFVSQM